MDHIWVLPESNKLIVGGKTTFNIYKVIKIQKMTSCLMLKNYFFNSGFAKDLHTVIPHWKNSL